MFNRYPYKDTMNSFIIRGCRLFFFSLLTRMSLPLLYDASVPFCCSTFLRFVYCPELFLIFHVWKLSLVFIIPDRTLQDSTFLVWLFSLYNFKRTCIPCSTYCLSEYKVRVTTLPNFVNNTPYTTCLNLVTILSIWYYSWSLGSHKLYCCQ